MAPRGPTVAVRLRAVALLLLAKCASTYAAVGMTWTQGAGGGAVWLPRSGHAAVCFEDGVVVTVAGQGTEPYGDVAATTEGGSALAIVTQAGGTALTMRHGHAIARVPGSSGSFLVVSGTDNTAKKNDALLTTDRGVSFVTKSIAVFTSARVNAGLVALDATTFVALGGLYDGPSNEVRKSTDSGANWVTLRGEGGANAPSVGCRALDDIFPARSTFGHTYMPLMARIVVAAGSISNYAKDVWYTDTNTVAAPVGKCWKKGGDIDTLGGGYNGPALIVVTLGTVEILVFAGGQNDMGRGYVNTVFRSHDGGVNWFSVDNSAAMWPGRDNFAMIFNPMNKEIAVLGGTGAPAAPWSTNDFWSAEVFTLFFDETVRPPRRLRHLQCDLFVPTHTLTSIAFSLTHPPLRLLFAHPQYTYTSAHDCTYATNSNVQCCGTSVVIIIDSSVVTIISGAFKMCTSVVFISFAEATSLTTIGAAAFEGLNALTYVDMSGAPLLATLEASAFGGCTALAKAKLASTTTSIGVEGFTNTALSKEATVEFNTVLRCLELTNGLVDNVFPFPCPTYEPTHAPTSAPTTSTPTTAPTSTPTTSTPTAAPTSAPTSMPTSAPTYVPSSAPTSTPTTSTPTTTPTSMPTTAPTHPLGSLVGFAADVTVTEDATGSSAAPTVLLAIEDDAVATGSEIILVTCEANENFAFIDKTPITITSSGVIGVRKTFEIIALWDTAQLSSRSTVADCMVSSDVPAKTPAPLAISTTILGVAQPSIALFCTNVSATSCTSDASFSTSITTNGGDDIVVIGGKCSKCPQPPFDMTSTFVFIAGIAVPVSVSADGEQLSFTTPVMGTTLNVSFGEYLNLTLRTVAGSQGMVAGVVTIGPGAEMTPSGELACAGLGFCPLGRPETSGVMYVKECIGYANPVIDFRWKTSKDLVVLQEFAYGGPPGQPCRICPIGCRCPGGDRCRPMEGYFLIGEKLPPGEDSAPALCHADLIIAKQRCAPWSSATGSTVCLAGTVGERCELCADRHYRTEHGTCAPCGSDGFALRQVGIIVGVFCAIFLIAFTLVAVVQTAYGRNVTSGAIRSMRFAGWVVSIFATQAQIGRSASGNQPDLLLRWYTLLKLFEFNPDGARPMECATSTSTLAPIAMSIGLACVVVYMLLAIPVATSGLIRFAELIVTPFSKIMFACKEKAAAAKLQKEMVGSGAEGNETSSRDVSLRSNPMAAQRRGSALAEGR